MLDLVVLNRYKIEMDLGKIDKGLRMIDWQEGCNSKNVNEKGSG